MDKRIILAVAGSGKTSLLIEKLVEENRVLIVENRVLIVTYATAAKENLRRKIIEKFNYVPRNIKLYTYFEFLYGFCYQPFMALEKKTNGITYDAPPKEGATKGNENYYMKNDRRLYSNRLALFIKECGITEDVKARMEKYFDVFLVDEVQDFAGYDFDFLLAISAAKLQMTFVGDFFQSTFFTSKDGNKNKNLHVDYAKYKARFEKTELTVDTTSLKKSHRCSEKICEFIRKNLGIEMESASDKPGVVNFEDDPESVRALYEDPNTVKLFFKEHHNYNCYSNNWGASKGDDQYQDVCVVISEGIYEKMKKSELEFTTRNKLYVACSRARGNLTFVPQEQIKDINKRRLL